MTSQSHATIDALLTAAEVRKALCCGVTTLCKIVKKRQLGSVKMGRKRLFKPADVREYIECRYTPAKRRAA